MNEFTVSESIVKQLAALNPARRERAWDTHPVLCGYASAYAVGLCLPRFRALPDLVAFGEFLDRLAAEPDAVPVDVAEEILARREYDRVASEVAAEEKAAADAAVIPEPAAEPVPVPSGEAVPPLCETINHGVAKESDWPVRDDADADRFEDKFPVVPDAARCDLKDRLDRSEAAAVDAGGELSDDERAAMAAAFAEGDDGDTFGLGDDEPAPGGCGQAEGERQESGPPVVTFNVAGPGVKFAGRCVKCGGFTGNAEYHRDRTLLVKDGGGKFRVAHPECVGGTVKNRVGGRGLNYSGPMQFECVDNS